MTPDERWLAAVWPFVRTQLPAAPARVVDIGCGPLGGFVPVLRSAGYQASGIDPEAPSGPGYCQVEFERCELPELADVIVACTSLHHVADLGGVLDLIDAALVPSGLLVVVEWAREQFDEATVRWCSARLPQSGDPAWLRLLCAEWHDSGQPWGPWYTFWAESKHLHRGQDVLRELDARFHSEHVSYGPYFFPDLTGTSEADEQAAIDSGEINASRIQYAGRRRRSRDTPAPALRGAGEITPRPRMPRALSGGCGTGQENAAVTSSATFFSTVGLHFLSAYDTGHMSPLSRFAASWKPRVE